MDEKKLEATDPKVLANWIFTLPKGNPVLMEACRAIFAKVPTDAHLPTFNNMTQHIDEDDWENARNILVDTFGWVIDLEQQG